MAKWEQELLWVKRDKNGVIVQFSDKPPQGEDFIPTIPTTVKRRPDQYKREIAAGQGD